MRSFVPLCGRSFYTVGDADEETGIIWPTDWKQEKPVWRSD
jgi:hypothetical protein